MIYDVDYFIEKYEAIPLYRWAIGVFIERVGGSRSVTKRCALGHCMSFGITEAVVTPEYIALCDLFNKYGFNVTKVNDGLDGGWHDNPKDRILHVLYFIKKKESKLL